MNKFSYVYSVKLLFWAKHYWEGNYLQAPCLIKVIQIKRIERTLLDLNLCLTLTSKYFTQRFALTLIHVETWFKVTVHPLATGSLMKKCAQDWVKWREVSLELDFEEIWYDLSPTNLVQGQSRYLIHKLYVKYEPNRINGKE